jgi:hypothetical protein
MATAFMNPYNWQVHRPQVEVPRATVGAVAEDLRRGGSFVLLAGRGMGKSVFLRQLQTALDRLSGVRSLLFSAPPAELTVRACIQALARKLGVAADDALDTHEVIETYLEQRGDGEQVVLLYDEFDRYARSKSSSMDSPGRDFFNNLESTRRDFPQLGILAAGSIGVFLFRDNLGSSFLARAKPVRLSPFDPPELQQLAAPFAEQARPLPLEVLEAMHLASGGNPALVTYGLESLWPSSGPTARDVAELYAEFQHRHSEFLRDFSDSFASPELSEAPQRIWALIQNADGPVSHAALRSACAAPDGILRLELADIIDLLQAAGLVKLTGSVHADPVNVRPVASILSLPRTSPPVPQLRDRLAQDLQTLLARLHAFGADFFRPGSAGKGKQLVPEAVFSAFLALGLELLGWQAEREAQHGAGRTDIKLRWQGANERVVIEVKIWGRGNYQEANRQVESYWSADIAAGAVVMITDQEIINWPDLYRQSCLVPLGLQIESESSRPPLSAQVACTTKTPDGLTTRVDHFLLRIARGH